MTNKRYKAVIHLAGIHDINRFANQLFDAKSNISDLTDDALVTTDYKQFIFSNKNGQSPVSKLSNLMWVLSRTDGIQQASELIRQRDGLDYMLVIIVDILNSSLGRLVATIYKMKSLSKHLIPDSMINCLIWVTWSAEKQFVTLEAFYAK